MFECHLGRGFLYCSLDLEIRLRVLMHGDLQPIPIHHVLASTPSIARDIASFFLDHRNVLGESSQLPTLVLLPRCLGVVLRSSVHVGTFLCRV
jgi:hypothetical protein